MITSIIALRSFIEDFIVEPTYLRVTIKGKILQLRFLEEVYCSEEKYVLLKNTSRIIKLGLDVNDYDLLKFLNVFISYSVTVERNRASGHLIIKMKKFKQDSNNFLTPKKESNEESDGKMNDSSNGEY